MIQHLMDNYKSEWPFVQHQGNDHEFVIVPDVHGRLDFVNKVLSAYPDKQIVFLGDILHSENRERWSTIERNFKKRAYSENRRIKFCEAMQEEGEQSLACLAAILGARETRNVVLLRGNHDDVRCNMVGDYGKYTQFMESSYFREWAKGFLGKEAYKSLLAYENKVPYVFQAKYFCASHAAPGFDVRKCRYGLDWEEIKLHQCFAWTDNREWDNFPPRSWGGNMEYFDEPEHWFVGHRPVYDGLTRVQMGGKLVQINHPDFWSVIEVDGPNWVAKELV